MAHLYLRTSKNRRRFIVGVLVVGIICLAVVWGMAATTRLDARSLKLGDSRAGAVTKYEFGYSTVDLSAIQTIVFQVCANDPFPGYPCTAPNGFDASNAVLADQSGDTGFLLGSATANTIILSRASQASIGGQSHYKFNNIVNPSEEGTYYVRVQTFTGSDTNDEPNNSGGLAFAINYGVDVTAVVPPYLLFCVGVIIVGNNCQDVSGNYVSFGELSSRQASTGRTQMLAATNARDGYTIRVAGTTMMAGNNVINQLAVQDVSRPGVSQFGLNLRANSTPQNGDDVSGPGNGVPATNYGQLNFYRFNPGDVVAVSDAPDDARKYTSAYIVNVPRGQAPGIYVSTITYIALGSF